MKTRQIGTYSRIRGAASVEFALVAAFGGFLTILFGALEMARILYYMNSANEATELGARVAIVCDANDSRIKNRMQAVFPALKPENINITYNPAGCAASAALARATCDSVTVSIASGMKVTATIPFVDFGFDMPAFSTTKSREAMNSASCA